MSHEERVPGEWMNRRNVTGCVVVSRTRTIFIDNTGVARFSAKTCFAHSFAFASVAPHGTRRPPRRATLPKARSAGAQDAPADFRQVTKWGDVAAAMAGD
jgi:hypothetical protein